MNKTETAYAEHLEARLLAQEIQAYWFEAFKMRLGQDHKCTYTPDFLVYAADDVLEFHEVKGYWEDDARVKIQTAARIYPFRFFAVKKGPKGTWITETIRE
jgi:hypothetical protein